MIHSITLNLPYDLSGADWVKVSAVYRSMNGWLDEHSSWFGPWGSERFIAASAEPSGLLVEGNVDPLFFRGWMTKLCAKLTAALGKEVHDAEL
ncbi:hypothetical protein [Pseudoduganella albidiflava]|uniref:Uncharacterized protein n=1 Tax=Pseudoduganella albidiflava TaxID=321983 RepID=A0A411X101_9BURK|nr:hypothetical protein [Pseudoduganella albidiflava]QBI02618.1 hypothetical protein EYF70_18525 [Pseudoduganella albidiflava]GGY41297.1 hypothetical protein GCM10007387_24040 [Pseudoduganella albidiflava]